MMALCFLDGLSEGFMPYAIKYEATAESVEIVEKAFKKGSIGKIPLNRLMVVLGIFED